MRKWIWTLALGALAQFSVPNDLPDQLTKKAPPPVQTQKKAPPVRQDQAQKKSTPLVRTQPIRINLPRTTVLQKARLGPTNYGTSNHAIVKTGRLPGLEPAPKIKLPATEQVRRGYYPYVMGWRDSSFAYPYYAFDYSDQVTVPSPWYYYPQLPGYLAVARITFGGFTIDYVDVRAYSWDPSIHFTTTSYDYPLNLAIHRLIRVFENQDMDALDSLIAKGTFVNIESEYGEQYQLRSSDFHDLMLDNVTTTRTLQFTVTQVEKFRAGARVWTLHTFVDPFGQVRRLQHIYVLLQDENGYHIASLRVSRT